MLHCHTEMVYEPAKARKEPRSKGYDITEDIFF